MHVPLRYTLGLSYPFRDRWKMRPGQKSLWESRSASLWLSKHQTFSTPIEDIPHLHPASHTPRSLAQDQKPHEALIAPDVKIPHCSHAHLPTHPPTVAPSPARPRRRRLLQGTSSPHPPAHSTNTNPPHSSSASAKPQPIAN